jgi:Fe-S cluster assembly protein SufD
VQEAAGPPVAGIPGFHHGIRSDFRSEKAPRTQPKEVHLHTFNAEGSAALAGPTWLRDRRAAALSAVESSAMPSESEEVWRYTPIDDLNLDDFAPVTTAPGELPEAGRIVAEMVGESLGQLSGQVVVHNGFPLSFGPQGGGGAALGGAADVPGGQAMVGSVQEGGDALVRLNDAFAPDAVLIDVPAGVVVPDPILIVHWCDAGEAEAGDAGSSGSAMFPRTAVRLGDGARAAVVEIYVGPIGSLRSLVVPVTELLAGDEASLSYVSLQILNHAAWSIARLGARGGKGSVLRTFTVGLGGDYDRVRADVSVDGRGARSEILSAYLGSGTQVHDIRTLQDHVAPRTNSELLCQGAVAGTSRSVYSGLIRVHRGAVRSDARQTNHNLVLDEGAHADSVPNLDILENDVKCSHASTVGPIDEDQRYYIESRGVTPDVAEGLIVRGFFDAIIDRGPVPAVTPLLKREVHARLDLALGDRRVIREAADV